MACDGGVAVLRGAARTVADLGHHQNATAAQVPRVARYSRKTHTRKLIGAVDAAIV